MVDIISRSRWGARAPRSRTTTTWSRRTEFVVHYSAGPTSQTPRQIQNFQMDSNGWSDVGYNFLVDTRGRVYEGRGWLVVGAHATGHNTSGIGVCFIGRDGDATAAAKRSIRAVYDEARRRAGRALAKRGHGQLSGNATACPGRELLNWVKAGMPVGEDEDMPTPKELWDHEIEVPWGSPDNPEWQADSILVNTGARARNIEAKIDALTAKIEAQALTIDKLVDAVAAGSGVDAVELKAEIRAAIESIQVEHDQLSV
jgi:N-acetylmuramoyl-L-alanine amidase